MIDASVLRPSTNVSRRRCAAVLGLLALAVGPAACTVELTPSASAIADEPEPARQTDTTRPGDAARPSVGSEPYTDLPPDEQARVDLFENTSPSVVYISTVTRRRDIFGRGVDVAQGTGTGFIWDAEGHVVTNFHVLQGASSARVVMHDQTSYIAEWVGGSERHDLAVLRIDAPPDTLQQVRLG